MSLSGTEHKLLGAERLEPRSSTAIAGELVSQEGSLTPLAAALTDRRARRVAPESRWQSVRGTPWLQSRQPKPADHQGLPNTRCMPALGWQEFQAAVPPRSRKQAA